MREARAAGRAMSASSVPPRQQSSRKRRRGDKALRWLPADRPDDGSPMRIALCVPMQGSAGIWGPSCLASAQLAQAELNRCDGIDGRPCELLLVDASDEAADLEHELGALIDAGEVDALVGMHISSVRQRIVDVVVGRLPYVYTCLHEGGAVAPGLFTIGETSARQLRPSLHWLTEQKARRRWALVGNDYVWPRVSHAIARRCLAEAGGDVVVETYVPFGTADYSRIFEALRRSRSEAVLISLVGQDAIEFNRAFAAAGLAGRILRLSCAIEENQLLAIGAANTENLHVVMGYFASLATDENAAFKERYYGRFGDRAPPLNSIGQSLYEGMHFLAALIDARAGKGAVRHTEELVYRSARRSASAGGEAGAAPVYLACAEGHLFRVIARF